MKLASVPASRIASGLKDEGHFTPRKIWADDLQSSGAKFWNGFRLTFSDP
jgi:hypothetical protein